MGKYSTSKFRCADPINFKPIFECTRGAAWVGQWIAENFIVVHEPLCYFLFKVSRLKGEHMTAQVAVLNLSGIAVASDTFVTTFTGGEAKSMGNSQKIYELGPQHKVAILHSGSIGINQIPHHLHLSEWSKSLSLPLPTLQAYVDSYRTWSASEKRMLTPGSEAKIINTTLNEHYYDLASTLDDSREGLILEEGSSDRKRKTAIQNAYKEAISQNLGYLNGLDNYVGVTEKSVQKSLAEHEVDVVDKVNYIFSRFELPQTEVDTLIGLASLILLKVQPMQTDSELAFVGFGEEEPFGGVIRMTCRGLYAGVLVALAKERYKVAPTENASGISYFAQREAMWAFIAGYTTDIMDEVKRLIWKKVEEKWGDTTEDPIGWNLAQEIESEVQAYSQSKFIDPMLSTIEAMGLNSLAELADSLVGLQATSTYSKAGAATVGGLIEVMTIDRINGIRWMRRLPATNRD